MTIDRASVEQGARLAADTTEWNTPEWNRRFVDGMVTVGDAAFIAHWNPEFAAELARELQRLWRVEEAAREYRREKGLSVDRLAAAKELDAALANLATTEEGDG